jgi:hypothetical protein
MSSSVTLQSRFKAIPDALKRECARLAARTALDIERRTKLNITELDLIDTGLMRSSTQALQVGDYEWEVVVGAYYAPFHEFGAPGANIPAQPFLGPAIAAVRPAFNAGVRALLRP